MTKEEFNKQLNRLASQFGKPQYGVERVAIIWRTVSELSVQWFEHLVDDLLSTAKFAPLPAEFTEAASLEREQSWIREKKRNEKEAQDIWAGTYQPEESRAICQTILQRMRGEISDLDWTSFMKLLNEAPPTLKLECRRCSDNGWQVDERKEGNYAYRCICRVGAAKPRGILMWGGRR